VSGEKSLPARVLVENRRAGYANRWVPKIWRDQEPYKKQFGIREENLGVLLVREWKPPHEQDLARMKTRLIK
jgi:hypothetical protein